MSGENLRTLRQAAGIRLCDLATETGFSESYLSLVEQGKRPFPQEHSAAWLRAIINIRERMAMAFHKTLEVVEQEAAA